MRPTRKLNLQRGEEGETYFAVMEVGSTGTFQRKHVPKKWTELYCSKIDYLATKRNLRLEHYAEDRKHDHLVSESYAENEHEDHEEYLKKLNVVRQLGVPTEPFVAPPVPPKDWNGYLGNQLNCYVCHATALSDCNVCVKCNLVAHTLCLPTEMATVPYNSTMRPGLTRLLSKSKILAVSHLCSFCDAEVKEDQQIYRNTIESLRLRKLREYCASVIARRVRIFLEQRRSRRKKYNVVLLQSKFRAKLMRAKYLSELKAKPRTVVFRFMKLPSFLQSFDSIVVLTVQDTFKNAQLFRFDKTVEQCANESIVIPGITWYMTVVISIAVREDGPTYYVAGQAQLSLRDLEEPLKRKDIPLAFTEKNATLPQETSGLRQAHLVAAFRSYASMFSPADFYVTLNYWPQNPVTTLCMMIFAPPLDILRRPADLSSSKKKKSESGGAAVMYRNSRYWVCLHNLKLWFFQYYSDVTPRFGSDVSLATATIVYDKGHPTSLINLVHQDQRAWILEFGTKADAKSFCLAISEGQKALSNSSIYVDYSEITESIDFGFKIVVH